MKQNFIVVFCLITFWSPGICQENYFKRLPVQSESSSNKESVIVTTEEGNPEKLLCFFKRTLIYPSYYRIHLSVTISEDGGYNWSDPDSIYYLTIDDSDIQAFVTNSGRILLSFKRFGYYLKYSDDGGLSWSSNIYLPAGSTASNTSFVQFPDNSIGFIYIMYPQLRIIYSYDDGVNWSESSQLFPFLVDKGKMIVSPAGEYSVFCTKPNDNNLYYTKSNDLISWSTLVSLDSGSTKIEKFNCTVNNSGHFIVTYERNIPTVFEGIFQKDIFQIVSTDNGNLWSTPVSITKFKGDDFNHSISKFCDGQVITFASSRDSLYEQLYYGFLPVDVDIKTPPAIYQFYHTPDEPEENQPVTFRAYVDDDTKVQSVKVVTTKNKELPITRLMYDDGLKNDSLSNDNIFGVIIPGLKAGDIVKYYCTAEDNYGNLSTTEAKYLSSPVSFSISTYTFDNNRLKIPISLVGNFADNIGADNNDGTYDDKIILFSGGFALSGYDMDFLWANAVLSSVRIQDYKAGFVGGYDSDPKNSIYIIKLSDPAFGESWQNYSYAVMIGAPFYDGDFDGNYIPVDKNNNGIWDDDEDAPEMLGDVTAWCVFNDGVETRLREFNNVYPLGIEIQQTIFSFNLNDRGEPDEKIYVRYRIINRGTVNTVLDSVIFSMLVDPDIGDYRDDLAGSDSLLNLVYAYNAGNDTAYGVNPPAIGTAIVQGPYVYIANETYTDLNSDGEFQNGIDIPIDTAISKNGSLIPAYIYPGAKNTGLFSSYVPYEDMAGGFPILNYTFETRYNQLGLERSGYMVNPCTYPFGAVMGGIDCNKVNPLIWYSGDPVDQLGWLNITWADKLFFLNTVPFTLKKNEPVDIWGVYVAGRGEDSLQSITKMKENVLSAHKFYEQLPITGERTPPVLPPKEYKLYQNYPNPFNPGTKIRYSIPSVISIPTSRERNLKVTLKVYDILGREVITLVNEEKPSGTYEVEFNASKYASGVYFYQLKAGSYMDTKKMLLIK